MYPPVKLLSFLNKENRVRLLISFFLITASSLTELVSIATVVPFLKILTKPELQFDFLIINKLNFLNIEDQKLLITILFSISVILSAVLRIYTLKYNTFQIAKVSAYLSSKAFNSAISLPYELHKTISSSYILSVLAVKMPRVNRALICFLQLINASVLVIALIIGLLFININITIYALLFFITLYFILAIKTKFILKRSSALINPLLEKETKLIQESYGSSRNILMNANNDFYTNLYFENELNLLTIKGQTEFFSTFPRFALEPLGVLFISLTGYIIVITNEGNSENGIAILGALALASQRILPALQQIYSGWAYIKARNNEINDVIGMLEYPRENYPRNLKKIIFKNVRLDSISFVYKSKSNSIFENVNLVINKGDIVGIKGKTGSGKSTLLDIIMGLIKPTKGEILVNNINIVNESNTEYLYKWRKSISTVPQNVFLMDSSFAKNIALGITKSKIDFEKVKKVAKIACIDATIRRSRNNYNENIGEQGITLSGGQKQRVGIARALYEDPDILILDEATSALDEQTENKVLNNILEFATQKKITVIIVSHRNSTMKLCTKLLELD